MPVSGFFAVRCRPPIPCVPPPFVCSIKDSLAARKLITSARAFDLPVALSSGCLYTRRQLDLPSSQVTPVTACPGLRPRWCPEYIAITHPELLPSIICKMSAFLPVFRKLSNDHKEQDFGAQYTACSLDPSGLGLLLPGLPSDFTTDLPAKL